MSENAQQNPKKNATLKGVNKVAAFMLNLDEEQVTSIFGLLDPQEIREITQGMINLGNVSAAALEEVSVEFAKAISGSGSVVGSMEGTERLLLKVLSQEQAEQIMEEIRGPAGRTLWEKLNNVNEDVLASYLKNEHPQTISVVMTKISPVQASKVIACLPSNVQSDVITRMLKIEAVRKEVLDTVEKSLRMEFMSNLARGQKRDPFEMVAEIFNNFDRAVEGDMMKMLEAHSEEDAERIRNLMFTFQDLIKIDASGIQAIIRTVDKAELSLALKGADNKLQDLFFKNMSDRAAKLMKDDMEAMGKVKLRDVEDAQKAVVAVAKDLADKDEITIADGRDEGDQLVG